ncbi:SDR family NAD(P)-dependent oxidoreductase [Carnobacterium gallinarum]
MRKKALVTGATSGIGKALAYQLAEEGYELILLSKTQESLFKLKHELTQKYTIACSIICLDLSNQSELKKWLEQEIELDVLVNCAGIGKIGDFQTLNLSEEEKIIQVNGIAPFLITKKFAQQFVQQDKGLIINICSTASFYPHPFLTVYGATKSFLFSYTLGLMEEVRRYSSNVRILAICPGPTKTPFFQKETRAKMAPDFLSQHFEMTPETVAKKIIQQFYLKKSYTIIGFQNKLTTRLIQVLPAFLKVRIVGRYIKKGL